MKSLNQVLINLLKNYYSIKVKTMSRENVMNAIETVMAKLWTHEINKEQATSLMYEMLEDPEEAFNKYYNKIGVENRKLKDKIEYIHQVAKVGLKNPDKSQVYLSKIKDDSKL